MITDEGKLYNEANNTCHILKKEGIKKVRDHSQENGKYRGPACNICNLRYKQKNTIPVIFHNAQAMISIYYILYSLTK